MPKVLAVFGATGHQGSSIINYVLNDPELSQKYKIRAITRDVNSEKVKHLKEQNVEVARGDVLDRASLETALTGAHTVFIMTVPDFGPDAVEVEYKSGKTITDVAVEKGAQYIIFSTLPSIAEISGGKYTKMTSFESKVKIEKHIRSLPIKSAFIAAGFFMDNFQTLPFMGPRQDPDGTWVLPRPQSPKTRLAFIDAVGDTGKFVGAILAEPDKYAGKTFYEASSIHTLEEQAAIISKTTGKSVVFKQVSEEEFKKDLQGIPPGLIEIFLESCRYQQEYGCFGPDTEKLVAWAIENARGKLTSLEEYFEAHPLKLS